MVVTIEEASAQLAQLIERAVSGEEVSISREGEPAIRLLPVAMRVKQHLTLPLPPRLPRVGKGQVRIASDFDRPLA